MKHTYCLMLVLVLSACGKEGAPPAVPVKPPAIAAQQIQEPADPMAAYCKAHPTEGMCAMGNIGF